MLLNALQATALLAMLGSAAAQTSVITVLLPGLDTQSIDGSIVAVGPAATTYSVNCPPGTPSDKCGLGPGFTLVNGPSTWEMHATMESAYKLDAMCVITSSATASCTQTMIGGESSSFQTAIETSIISDINTFYMPITVTAGLEKLGASPGATTTSGTASPTKTGSSTNSPNAAAPKMTQQAVLVAVAGVVGGVMML